MSINSEPLTSQLRLKTIANIFGQRHILAPGKILQRMMEADNLSSIVLYRPFGTGKTTIARVIATMTNYYFTEVNAMV